MKEVLSIAHRRASSLQDQRVFESRRFTHQPQGQQAQLNVDQIQQPELTVHHRLSLRKVSDGSESKLLHPIYGCQLQDYLFFKQILEDLMETAVDISEFQIKKIDTIKTVFWREEICLGQELAYPQLQKFREYVPDNEPINLMLEVPNEAPIKTVNSKKCLKSLRHITSNSEHESESSIQRSIPKKRTLKRGLLAPFQSDSIPNINLIRCATPDKEHTQQSLHLQFLRTNYLAQLLKQENMQKNFKTKINNKLSSNSKENYKRSNSPTFTFGYKGQPIKVCQLKEQQKASRAWYNSRVSTHSRILDNAYVATYYNCKPEKIESRKSNTEEAIIQRWSCWVNFQRRGEEKAEGASKILKQEIQKINYGAVQKNPRISIEQSILNNEEQWPRPDKRCSGILSQIKLDVSAG